MAIVKNDPFPGTDYSRYQEWEKVVMPNGETYYVVPGHPAYVLDKTASNATGRTVFRNNPKPAIDEAEAKKRQQDELINQEKFNRSPMGQLLPIGASTAAMITAHELTKDTAPSLVEVALADRIKQETANEVAKQTINTAVTQQQAAAQGFTNGAAPNVIGVSRVSAPTGVGPVADGGQYASNIEGVAPPVEGIGSYIGPAISTAATLKGGYDVFKSQQNGGKGIRTAATELGAGIGSFGGPITAGAGAAIGNLAGYGLQGKGIKNDIALIAAAPGLGIPIVIGRRFFGFDPMHKTTRQVAQEHTADLLNQGKDDKGYQQYVTGMREQYNAAPPDPSKPFAGKYETWEDYQKGGLEANDLTGVYGNIKTYGPAWANLTQDQRVAVTDANIKSGIYTSNKGEVEITDEAKAKENFDNVMKGFNAGVKATTQGEAAAQGSTQTNKPLITPIRSTTRSPGIGMDGKPIFVSR